MVLPTPPGEIRPGDEPSAEHAVDDPVPCGDLRDVEMAEGLGGEEGEVVGVGGSFRVRNMRLRVLPADLVEIVRGDVLASSRSAPDDTSPRLAMTVWRSSGAHGGWAWLSFQRSIMRSNATPGDTPKSSTRHATLKVAAFPPSPSIAVSASVSSQSPAAAIAEGNRPRRRPLGLRLSPSEPGPKSSPEGPRACRGSASGSTQAKIRPRSSRRGRARSRYGRATSIPGPSMAGLLRPDMVRDVDALGMRK